MFEKLQKQLDRRKNENSFRELKSKNGLVDFCSNDYLGIARLLNVNVTDAVGSTGSRLLQGNYALIEGLEDDLADFHKSGSALVYNSGYVGNIGLFSAIPQKGDVIFYDEFIHASVKDGMRLSFAKSFSFKHNDVEDLEKKYLKLQDEISGDVFVAVESVYSMDGDKSPLVELVELSKRRHFALVVDEAHAVGVYGNNGEGLVQALGLEDEVAIRLVTFSKALGCHGAAVLASGLIKEYLVNFSRSFIYSTALPPMAVRVIKDAYSFMRTNEQNKLLQKNIMYFKVAADANNLKGLISSDSAVQCIVIPGNKESKKSSEYLQEKGFDVRAILSPTVPLGSERLRICIHSFNTETEIDELILNLSTIKNIK